MIEHLPGQGITIVSHWIFNCYVVHDGGLGCPLVVDAGLPTTAGEVLEVLRRLPGGGAPVVVATHLHVDHVGGVASLVAQGATFVVPDRVRAWRAGDAPVLPAPADVAKIGPVLGDQPLELWPLRELATCRQEIGVDPRAGLRLPMEPDGWLCDGAPVPGAPDWKVLVTPGHTDDSTSLWNERTRVLVSGDAVLAVGRRAWFNPELADLDATRATERRLRALPVDLLLPGHGRAVGGDVMAGAISHAERPDAPGMVRGLLRQHRQGRRCP